MPHSNESVSLPEKDYLAILDGINEFNKCRTKEDLKSKFKSCLLPLLAAQSALYAWGDPELTDVKIIDTVNIPDNDLKTLGEYLTYDPAPKENISHSRPVFAHDVDIPRHLLNEQIDSFFDNRPDNRSDNTFLSRCKSTSFTFEIPEPTVGIALHRWMPYDDPWTLREIRILELMRPHLLHSIKTIVLTEELSKYKSLADKLAELPSPLALVAHDFRLIFLNSAFSDLFQKKPGERLPEEMVHLLRKEISRYEAPYDIGDSKIEIPFVSLPQGMYRLSLSRVDGDVSMEDGMWLLRMKPVIEPYSKMNILMQEAGLTGREFEICILIRDGFENQEIAARLFISLHTVKNHVRNIYQKMGVHTRAQLVALLNKPAEELG